MNKNGLLSGSVLFPGKTKATIFKGAALQLSATAFGSFNGTNQTGGFMIYPQP